MPAQGRVEGVVLDVLGQPIPLAKLRLEIEGQGARTARADGQGCFAMPDLPLDTRLWMVAGAEGHQPRTWPLWLKPYEQEDFETISLDDAAPVHGQVVDPHGSPIANALVMLADDGIDVDYEDVPLSARHAVTDAEGRYSLPALPVGRVRLAAVAPGFDLAVARPFLLSTMGACDFTLRPGVTATYRIGVAGASRDLLERLHVSFVLACQGLPDSEMLQLPFGEVWPRHRNGGRIVFAGLPAGLVSEFQFSIDGHVLDDAPEVPEGPGVHDVDVALMPAALRLRGRLCDPGGRPLARVRVVERWDEAMASAVTDAEGRFGWNTREDVRHDLELDNGDYALHTEHPELLDRVLHSSTFWAAPDQLGAVAIIAAPAATVCGRVVDASGAPVRGASVMLLANFRDATRPLYWQWRGTCCRGDGSFEIRRVDGLFTEPLWLFVGSEQGEAAQPQPLVGLAPGARIDVGTVRLPAGASIEGIAADARGVPIPGASVAIEGAGADAVTPNGNCRTLRADRTGRFRAGGLPAGEYVVQVAATDTYDSPPAMRVRLRAGECRRLDVGRK